MDVDIIREKGSPRSSVNLRRRRFCKQWKISRCFYSLFVSEGVVEYSSYLFQTLASRKPRPPLLVLTIFFFKLIQVIIKSRK